jgi:hypothetical protein
MLGRASYVRGTFSLPCTIKCEVNWTLEQELRLGYEPRESTAMKESIVITNVTASDVMHYVSYLFLDLKLR